ncbi:alpha-mannosyltransferase Alg11p [Colletotrichum tofieldiae]|nr:alpha-mannosyltransferase Alg11p [Colletotrichum tofieldiae]GKT77123.1 alpha-mannosyltransferase Alg11p [Colletotrichum tofieldiae]
MSVSNARPLAIFTGYMVLAASLTAKSIGIIRGQQRVSSVQHGPARSTNRHAIAVFSILAAVSLATTWYHMFRFFEWSYVQWDSQQFWAAVVGGKPAGLRLGEWLRDTSLFRQAWASTLETGPRAWWSLQIFGFCANWSVLLAAQAQKRRIPHAWVFVLLGQVVAISFAANMSFLAILCSKVPTPAVSKSQKNRDETNPAVVSWHTVVLVIILLWATIIPAAIDHPRFLSLLLGPHLLAFAPLVLNKVLPSRFLGEPGWYWKAASMAWMLAVATKRVVDEGEALEIVLKTLYEHPAVSSVGWDVICCWVSSAAWFLIGTD